MGEKKSYKSFRFKAGVVWEGGRRGLITSAGKPDVMVGSPPEFKGEAGVWSPEELLVSSVNTCLMLTYLTLAQARGLPRTNRAPKDCWYIRRTGIASPKCRFSRRSH